MELEEYGRLAALERRHWWFRAKRSFVDALLVRARAGPPPPGAVVVDIGCGAGGLLVGQGEGVVTVGLDDHAAALLHARRAGVRRLVQAGATAVPLADGCADRVFLLDVAEHVPDDRRAFAEVRRLLKPDGVALVHVPAHPRLWSRHDEAMHHVRRYTRSELEARLAEAGLEPVALSYTFGALLAPAAVLRLGRGGARDDGTDFEATPRWADGPLAAWHRLEAAWLRRFGLPFGLSLGAAVRRARRGGS